MGKFDALPDLPGNWLDLLFAETLLLQKKMPQDREQAILEAQRQNLADLQELELKCPELGKYLRISSTAIHTGLLESGVKDDMASVVAGRFVISSLGMLRLLAMALRQEKGVS